MICADDRVATPAAASAAACAAVSAAISVVVKAATWAVDRTATSEVVSAAIWVVVSAAICGGVSAAICADARAAICVAAKPAMVEVARAWIWAEDSDWSALLLNASTWTADRKATWTVVITAMSEGCREAIWVVDKAFIWADERPTRIDVMAFRTNTRGLQLPV